MAKERVEPEEILAKADAAEAVTLKPLQPIQRIGLWLAGCVGFVILVVIVFVLCDYVRNVPPAPVLSSSTSSQATLAELSNYKAAQELVLDRTTKIFDLIVVKALLPVFTGILGYIFGTRSSAQEPS